MTIVIATIKSWNIRHAKELMQHRPEDTVHIITDKKEMTAERINELKPDYLFFPHWSSCKRNLQIPDTVFNRVEFSISQKYIFTQCIHKCGKHN